MRPSSLVIARAIGLIVFLAAARVDAVRIHVDFRAVGTPTGADWANAFTDLQSALAAATSGDEIWVATGTYTPGPVGDTASSFRLKQGVALYGGFAGSEYQRAQRNWLQHPTTLTGDLGHDDEYGPYAWYQGWNIHTPNSVHVLQSDGNDAGAVVDGFTIMAGSGGAGGGLYLSNSHALIRNCTLLRNSAGFTHGGGAFCVDSSATFSFCRFIENYVHLGSGGGIYITGASALTVVDCTFTANQVITSAGGAEGQGAGIENRSTQPVAVTRCTFDGNSGRSFYSCCPIEIARGGGISSFTAGLIVRDCIFRNNQAHAGGGMYVWGNTTIINSVFYNNTASSIAMSGGADGGGFAGGIGGLTFTPADTSMVNCVIVGNHASEGAGFEMSYSHRAVLRNCIVWGNIATGQDVSARDGQFRGSHDFRYSCVQDLLTPIPGEDPPNPSRYPGCIVVEPVFRAFAVGDLRLSTQSPCIDAAENQAVSPAIVEDLVGHLRFVDAPAIPDTGAGTAPIVDMGAYEFAPVVTNRDLTEDGYVDLDDIAVLQVCGTGPAIRYDAGYLPIGCLLSPDGFGRIAADLDSDADVDMVDFASLQRCFSGPRKLPDPNCAG